MVNQNDINCPVAAVVKTAMVTPEIAALHPPREKGRSTTMLGHSATCLVGKSGTLVGAQHGAAFVLSEGMPFSSFFDLPYVLSFTTLSLAGPHPLAVPNSVWLAQWSDLRRQSLLDRQFPKIRLAE